MTAGAVALGVGAALLGVVVTVAAWGGRGWGERLLGRSSLVALLGSVAVGLLVIGALAATRGA